MPGRSQIIFKCLSLKVLAGASFIIWKIFREESSPKIGYGVRRLQQVEFGTTFTADEPKT
jgi:hypothetical protein